MKTTFSFDITGVTFGIIMLMPGFLMMAFAFIGFNSVVRIILALLVGVGLLVALWFGLGRGTYITIDENKNVYNTFFFIKKRAISLSDVIFLSVRGAFMGAITNVDITYRKKNGKLVTNGLVSKQSLKRQDFKKLIEMISNINPNINIPDELLKIIK